MRCEPLVAPFPYFGGKRSVAAEIWKRLGNVENYIEPFAGSLATLLARPHEPKVETVNDKDRFLANFWRAVAADPEAVAHHANWPVNEADLEARHYWLVTEGAVRLAAVLGDPAGYDVQVAGWWLWGACAWIGSGWCGGEGPWFWTGDSWDKHGNTGQGINRQLPHIGDAGRGINRKLPHIGDAGQGINRQLPHIGGAGRGDQILDWMRALSTRLRNVRVACGEWTRVCGDTPTLHVTGGYCGVLLDPPYAATDRADVYTHECYDVSAEARAWAIEAGKQPRMRIAFCGYAGEHDAPWPADWTEWAWKARGGYGSQNEDGNANSARERIWFSPHCLGGAKVKQGSLFEAAE